MATTPSNRPYTRLSNIGAPYWLEIQTGKALTEGAKKLLRRIGDLSVDSTGGVPLSMRNIGAPFWVPEE